ncbi:hypothetical protein BN7_5860 [Wickerhamomyces ciferrii]|uniref:Uncharacterized protein n=1 Tax=Wickerhamomyces ciferrii (strain ATCC 14091 / BCRC 22168 / CBS 111 / JCM 3599 / NBRC 0793 / NRRL Y-1031 F-60-10) TaxID=1206466 RepID=K0KYX6_WICCF|nr:uncharacterized protein BN7_5860 [Wickerhamomyces ciferrii]CCH46268.1 hypothetical protein BN7_5860 [Wickerhamomyces ciferrii]
MAREFDELVQGINESLLKYHELVENRSIFKQYEGEDHHNENSIVQDEKNESLTLEEVKPQKRLKSKNVYKRTKADIKLPKINDLSGIEGESIGNMDQSFEANKEEESYGTELTEPCTLALGQLEYFTDAFIYMASSKGFPTLSSLSAFKIGLTEPKNETELMTTPYYTMIDNQYGLYYKLGHSLRNVIQSGHLMSSLLLPKIFQKCIISKLPICEMLIEQVIQEHELVEFWERIEIIETIAQGTSIDTRKVIFVNCLDYIEACNDEHLSYLLEN